MKKAPNVSELFATFQVASDIGHKPLAKAAQQRLRDAGFRVERIKQRPRKPINSRRPTEGGSR
jgi:ribosomal protein S11